MRLINILMCLGVISANLGNYTRESKETREDVSKKYSSHADIEITTNFDEFSLNTDGSSLRTNVKYNYAISLYNDFNYFKTLTKIDLNCKYFVHFENIKDYKSFYFKTDKLDYDKYILLLENSELLREVQATFYTKQSRLKYVARNDTGYRAIIYNNSTMPLSSVIQDIQRPILLADDSTFQKIRKLEKNINNSNGKKTRSIRIFYDNTDKLLPLNYLIFSSSVSTITALVVFIWWHVKCYINRKHFTAIHKVLTALLYIKCWIIWLIYLYVDNATTYNISPGDNLFYNVYLETGVSIFSSVYRTILFFFIILLAYGWKLFFNGLGNEETRKFIFFYLIIYGSVCFDQLLDFTFGRWNYFLPSELKNMLFNLLFTGLIIVKCTSSLAYLKRKLVYAYEYSPDFIQGLRRKIRMLVTSKSNLMFSVSLNSSLIIFVHPCLRIHYSKYTVFENVINHININNIDLLFFCALLYTFRCRKQPDSFYIQLATSDELLHKANTQVYKVTIPSETQNKHKYNLKQNKMLPAVIVNPFYQVGNKMEEICIGISSTS